MDESQSSSPASIAFWTVGGLEGILAGPREGPSGPLALLRNLANGIDKLKADKESGKDEADRQ